MFLTPHLRSILFSLGIALAATVARAETMTAAIDALADELSKRVSEHAPNDRKVTITGFTRPANVDVQGGPAIAQLLREALPRHKVLVVAKSSLSISGQYFLQIPETSENQPRLKLTIQGTLDRSNGMRLCEFKKEVDLDIELGVAMLAPTVELTSTKTGEERLGELVESVHRPKPFNLDATSTIIRPTKDSQYALQILVKRGETFEPLKVENHDGEPFVQLSRGDVYRIRLFNDSKDHLAAARVTIDGVSLFVFSKAPYEHMIVPTAKAGDVFGWFVDEKSFHEFEVAPKNVAVAAVFPPSDEKGVGAVTVAFSAAVTTDDLNIKDFLDEEGIQTRSLNATAKGPLREQDLTITKVVVGKVRTVISVRYSR